MESPAYVGRELAGKEGFPGHVVKARVRVRHHGCISESLTDGSHAAQISSDRDSDILVMHGRNEAQVEAFIAYIRQTQNHAPEVLSRTPLSVILRGRNPVWGVTSTILQHGCTILWPSIWAEGHETYSVVAPSRGQLDALLFRLNQMGSATLDEVTEVHPAALDIALHLGDLTSGLTERQLAVLRRAIEEGYYDSPRRTSAEALAKEFSVSRSTLDEHLRKAERSVLERFASMLSAHPVLVDAASKGRGRPKAR